MDAWRSAQITGNLEEVPGIGPASSKKLSESDEGPDRITNTFQLFGKFLMLKGPGHGDEIMVEPVEHTQKFWEYLKNRGISSHRSATSSPWPASRRLASTCVHTYPNSLSLFVHCALLSAK